MRVVGGSLAAELLVGGLIASGEVVFARTVLPLLVPSPIPFAAAVGLVPLVRGFSALVQAPPPGIGLVRAGLFRGPILSPVPLAAVVVMVVLLLLSSSLGSGLCTPLSILSLIPLAVVVMVVVLLLLVLGPRAALAWGLIGRAGPIRPVLVSAAAPGSTSVRFAAVVVVVVVMVVLLAPIGGSPAGVRPSLDVSPPFVGRPAPLALRPSFAGRTGLGFRSPRSVTLIAGRRRSSLVGHVAVGRGALDRVLVRRLRRVVGRLVVVSHREYLRTNTVVRGINKLLAGFGERRRARRRPATRRRFRASETARPSPSRRSRR